MKERNEKQADRRNSSRRINKYDRPNKRFLNASSLRRIIVNISLYRRQIIRSDCFFTHNLVMGEMEESLLSSPFSQYILHYTSDT